MNSKDIIAHRLIRHQIATTSFTQPEEIVGYYGAMQAQEWSMVKWALGLRLPGLKEADIDKAFNEGKFLRTHMLRPTWHLVLPKDIRWIQKLTSPSVHQANKLYYKKFGIDGKLLHKTSNLISKSLEGKNFLTREELNLIFEKNRIVADGIKLAYIIMHAELEGLICSGPRKGKQFTYALLDEIIPAPKLMSQEASLKKLAHIYFSSRSPATVHDFSWWSGLTVKDAKLAVEMLDKSFIRETIDGTEYIIQPMDLPDLKGKQTTFLMPDYDEYGLSYKDRKVYNHPKWKQTEKLPNADYFHAIAVEGYFGGMWSKKLVKNKLSLEVKPFSMLNQLQLKKVNAASKRYQQFFSGV